MKKEAAEVRNIVFKLRLNQTEKNRLQQLQQKSIEKDLSSYIRKVSLKEPVVVKYRNASADDFLECVLQLKKELNAIGNNFNQAVKKLHVLDKIPEFRFWINKSKDLQQLLVSKTEEIRIMMHQLSEQWSQK